MTDSKKLLINQIDEISIAMVEKTTAISK